jgi:hypothetical protein
MRGDQTNYLSSSLRSISVSPARAHAHAHDHDHSRGVQNPVESVFRSRFRVILICLLAELSEMRGDEKRRD